MAEKTASDRESCTFAHGFAEMLQLAGGLAHEIKNPLSTIRLNMELLAEDLQALVESFYPPQERVGCGWMVFTGTQASGGKARPGQAASDHVLVTLAWPVLLPEDLQQLAAFPAGKPHAADGRG